MSRMQFFIKTVISALIIAGVSELGKRFTPLAALLASLPVTSILAMTWLYRETGETQKVAELSSGIFWAVLPSLLFFIVLPSLLKIGWKFGWAMAASSVVMFLGYSLYAVVLNKFGLKI